MPYRSELGFLKRTLEKCHLRLNVIDSLDFSKEDIDLGLRRSLGWDTDYDERFGKSFKKAKTKTIYRLTDPLGCRYMFFKLPERKKPNVVIIGPYFPVAVSYDQMLERAEAAKVSPAMVKRLQNYVDAIPVLSADSPLFSAIDTFAEQIWAGSYFEEDIGEDVYQNQIPPQMNWDENYIHDTPMWSTHELEERYQYENELIRAVSLGQTHKAEQLMAGFTMHSFENRMSDPVRNMKNYCIIANTILRKAAESGSVHPFYIDRISSEFSREIESITTVEGAERQITKMIRAYCQQVRDYTTRHYSLPVQNVILHIDSNLSGDLSLKALAEAESINASYLSALFKRETGKTITDYVNNRRVEIAKSLLGNTKLQIQTISQHCGISDVNYFSKIFKKYTKKTPKEYRAAHQQIGQSDYE